jgi:gas vesicle protein
MENNEKADAFGALAIFALGMASGAALALVCAPASGKRTREYIGNSARQARDQVAAAAQKARDLAEQGRQAAATVVKEFRPTVDAVVTQGRRSFEQGREAYEEAMSEGRG